MTFQWPELLWLLAGLPLLVAAYLWLLARKRRSLARYSSLAFLQAAQGAGPRWRRHVPPLLYLVAIALMLLAIARPAAVVTLPSSHETIVLAMDVSGSMRAKDVEPDRITAAQNAARSFINDQPNDVRIGIVSFAATASVVQYPTQNREDLQAAIDRFALQRGTAIGSAILMSLKAIFPDADFDLRTMNPRRDPQRDARKGDAAKDAKGGKDAKDGKAGDKAEAVPPGSFTSAAIILLTDGQTTAGPDPFEAAKMAAERGVRVFTVGIGTLKGEVLGGEGWSMRVRLDEDALKRIAATTQGEYFYAGNAKDLKKIYDGLNARFSLEKRQTEITAFFAAAAVLAMVAGALLSLLWFSRIL